MADNSIVQVMKNAEIDARSWSQFINADAHTHVETRLSEGYPSLQEIIRLITQTGVGFTPFQNKALMNASTLGNGRYAIVTNDTADNNGLYLKSGGVFKKVAWDIDERHTAKVDKALANLNSLSINKGKLYPFVVRDREGLTFDESLNDLESAILDIKVKNAQDGFYYRMSYVVLDPNDEENSGNNNGWQFSRLEKDKYASGVLIETLLSKAGTAKYRVEPNSGIVEFTIDSTEVASDGEEFIVTLDTTGLDSFKVYRNNSSTAEGFNHIIDPLKYEKHTDSVEYQVSRIEDGIANRLANLNSLSINKGKLYPFTIQKRGDFAYDDTFISPIEAAILSIQVNNAHPDYYYRLRYVRLSENDLDNSDNNNGWQFAKMLKSKWAAGEISSDMVTNPAATKQRLVANSGVNKFTIVATDNSDVSFDIVIDTDGLDTEATYLLNVSASNGFDHIIDPAFYKIKDYYKKSEVDNLLSTINNDSWVDKLRSEYLLSEPSIVAESYGILPIDAAGNADFDNPLFFQNISSARYPASLTKVLTALVALESSLELSDMITIASEDNVGGSGNNLNIGEKISFEDALYNMMLPSSNVTATAVARTVGSLNGGNGLSKFVDLMNAKAVSIGMTNSHFVNPTGLSNDQQLTTLSDMFRLGYAAVTNPVLRDIWSAGSRDMYVTGSESRVETVYSSFEAVRSNYWCLGGKTGTLGSYTNIMCHVALQNGYKGILVILKSNGQQNRIDDALKITNYVRNSYSYPSPPIITRN